MLILCSTTSLQAQIFKSFGDSLELSHACSCGGEHCGNIALRSSPSVLSAKFDPFVMYHGVDKVRFLIEVSDKDVVAIKWKTTQFERNKEPQSMLTLLDDGSQGDEKRSDKIFTIDGLSFRQGFNYFEFGPSPSYNIQIPLTLVYRDGKEINLESNPLYSTLVLLNPGVIPKPSITRRAFGADIDHTDYVISMIRDSISQMEIAKRYYQFMKDDRDFLFIAYQPSGTSNVAGFYQHVQGRVGGIGVSIFNRTADFGSNGKLNGIVTLLPSSSLGLLNHEILHNWAAFLNPSLNLNIGAHWSIIERPSTGFGSSLHGAYTSIEHVGDNFYRAKEHSWDKKSDDEFNDLELYLMGLIDIDKVKSPIRTLVNPTTVRPLSYVQENGFRYGIFKADSIRAVNVSDIIARHGVRSPQSREAQTSFSGAMIVAHHKPLTETEFAYYDFMMREYEKENSNRFPINITFKEATKGLASISTNLSRSMPEVITTNINNRKSNDESSFLHIYPNPSNGMFNIEFLDSDQSSPTLIRVYDAMGNKLEEVPLHHSDRESLNLSGLPSGIYTISITRGAKRGFKRLIKF